MAPFLEEPPAGYGEWLPAWDVVPPMPAWVADLPLTVAEPPAACGGDCACGGAPVLDPVEEDEKGWAVPGLWGEASPALVPSVGELVGQLQDVLGALAGVDPTALSEGQALGEAEALLGAQRELRVLQLARTEDVAARGLHAHRGFRSSTAWLRSVAPDAVSTDRTLARRLERLPFLSAALHAGRVSLVGAGKTAAALVKVSRYLDCPDGLVDGVDGEDLVVAVGENVLDLICRHHMGLSAEDPAQAALLAELQAAIAAVHAGGGSQAGRVEQLLVLLTAELPVRALAAALEDVVLAIVPSPLEEREKAAQDKRALGLSPNPDGTWELSGTLTPECGERLFVALAAEARRDPANPVDTLLREQHRHEQADADGTELDPTGQDLPAWEREALNGLSFEPALRGQPLLPPADPGPVETELLMPRSRSKRLHDALNRLLERYLSSGLGGVHGKVPVQAIVTLSARTLEGRPGAPPGRGASGRPLARSLIRSWWCDAHVTTMLLDHGWTPLGIVHSARTLTGPERKAATVQFDNRCAGDGCCPGAPDPLIPLVPHHVIGHAVTGKTSLGETLLCCPTLHHDLHTGKRTVRLRNGRLLAEEGYLEADV